MTSPSQYFSQCKQSASLFTRLQLMRVKAARWTKAHHGNLLLKTSPSKPVIALIIHPCVIQGQLTLVHARDLASADAEYYQKLCQFAEAESYVLLPDRRYKDSDVEFDRRGGWLPVMALTAGLQTGAVVANETYEKEAQSNLALFDARPGVEMLVGSNSTENHLHDHLDHKHSVETHSDDPVDEIRELTALQVELEAVLREHYYAQAGDPDYLQEDMSELALYFSRYPEAVNLLLSLKDQSWRLAYKKDTFLTEVRGSQVQVRSVTVYFDSRAAAQLRNRKACITQPDACTASPADALLHELLHAESALLKPREFIAQGGLNSVIYPYAHEYAVIKREGELYRAMSSLDGQLRPHRNAHAGKLVASSCVTCID